MQTTHRLISANSNTLLDIPDKSIQLVVTSPPYPIIEMWDGQFSSQDKSIEVSMRDGDYKGAFEKMHCLLDEVWRECDRVLADNGFICINVGDATRTFSDSFSMFSNHTRIIQSFLSLGYTVLPDIHWRKQSNAPNKFMGSGMYPAGAYVTYEHEYILIFRKGGKRTFSGEAKRVRQESAYFWEERNVWFSDLWNIKGTPQKIANKNNERTRNASFPLEIPYRLVNMYSIKGDSVLDPFCGVGTTTLACMLSQRNSIGVDISPEMISLAKENIETYTPSQLNSQIDSRLSEHICFITNLPQDEKEKCYHNSAHGFLVKTRQETSLHINHIASVQNTEENIICDYSN